ncbi:MAG: tetratricopeptide repeat protein [Solirubrobacteraceae bacterium]
MSTADRTAEPATGLGNVPVSITPLVGRDQALAELVAVVADSRLVTLSGPAGAGKSRLACAVAGAVLEEFPGGTWWADLGDLADDAENGLVAQTVAAAVLPGEQLGEPAAALARRLAPPSLLVLDNCEHVAGATARLVVDLLARVSALRLIVTSRQSLGIAGERVWRVDGLATGGDAESLFIARAQEAAGGFDPDARGGPEAVAEICRLLDGLPLAIELAAARASVLSPRQIADRLGDDISLLRHTSRAAPGRHRTLDDTLEWSHRLLASGEQRLFRRLAAFRGPFSLRAAETTCADGSLPRPEILDLLSVLIDQSLVQVVESPTVPRYRLLGTMRRYAHAKLVEAGELEATLDRHADHYHSLATEIGTGLAGPEQLAWAQGLELDHDNLSDALARLFEREPSRGAELALALWPLYYQRGWYEEARGWYQRALAHEADLPSDLRVQTLLCAADVAFLQCDYEVARGHLSRTLEQARSGELDPRAEASARQRLGSIAREQRCYDEARARHREAMAIWAQLGDAGGVAASRSYLGFIAWLDGDFDGAEHLCGEALAEFRRSEDLRNVVLALVYLGGAALYRGEPDLASQRLAEALSISRRLAFAEGLAWSLHELAVLAQRHRRPVGDPEAMLRDALIVHHELGDRWRVASVLEEIAGSALARRDPPAAVRLLACAHSLRERIGAPVPAVEATDLELVLGRLRRQLPGAAFGEAWAQGSALELDRAVGEALERLGESPGDEMAPILTPRELAVLDLLSRGHTNREIAERLYISPSTAGVHVSNILRKLQAKRRVDAAGRAQKLGLLPAA